MKQFSLLMVLILMTTLTSAHASEKTAITIACFPPLDRAFEAILPNFYRNNPNIEVKIISQGFSTHHNYLLMDLSVDELLPDVTVIESSYLSKLNATNGLEDLGQEPYRAKKFRRFFEHYKWLQATNDEGYISTFPLDTAVGCVYWRRDHFAEAGVRIENIKTMDDLFIAAGKLTRDLNGDGRMDRWFIENAEDIGLMILRSNDRPLITFSKTPPKLDKERLRAAFTWARRFRIAGYDAGLGPWSSEGYRPLSEIIAYKISGSWLGWHLNRWIAPKTSGKWGVSSFPSLTIGGKPMSASWGGSFLSIPKKAEHKKEAWEFIRFACTNKQQQVAMYKASDSFPAFEPSWKDPVFDEQIEFFAGQPVRRLYIHIAKEIPVVPCSKYDSIIDVAVETELRSVLNEGKNIDQSIIAIEKRLTKEVQAL